jgi:hypothetical protein
MASSTRRLGDRPAHRSALASLYGSAVSGPNAEMELCELESVIFVARTIGDADILLTIRAFSVAQLSHTVDRIRSIRGVQDVLEIVKEAYGALLVD